MSKRLLTQKSDGGYVQASSSDDFGTIGALEITAATGAFTGNVDVSSGSLSTSALQKKAILEGAASNIDIGAYSLTAGNLVSGGLTPTRVVFAGSGGLLSDSAAMVFQTDTLTVTKLGAFQAVGTIDFNDQTMSSVAISSGTISGLTSLDLTSTSLTIDDEAITHAMLPQMSGQTILGVSGLSAGAPAEISLSDLFNNAKGLFYDWNTGKAEITVDNSTIEISTADLNGSFAGTQQGLKVKDGGIGDTQLATLSSVDIDGGAIDGTPIGASSASTGAFSTLAASGAATLSSTLAVTGQSEFSDNLFPNSATAAVDIGGNQGTTEDAHGSLKWFEDAGFSNLAEGSDGVQPKYDNASYQYEISFFKDAACTIPSVSSDTYTTNDPSSWAAYTDGTFNTEITAPNSGSMGAVILTWDAADYPDASERAGDMTRWNRVRFADKYTSIEGGPYGGSLEWDDTNYQVKIDFGSVSQLIDSTWHGTSVRLMNEAMESKYVQVEFESNQGLAEVDLESAALAKGSSGNINISDATLVSGQIFKLELESDMALNDWSASYSYPYFYFGQSDKPSLYLRMSFSTYDSSAPSSASDISSVKDSGGNDLATASIVDGGISDSQQHWNVTFVSAPASDSGIYFTVGSTELRYFQDINARRAFRLKATSDVPTTNGSEDSALYVKDVDGVDELHWVGFDASNTIQMTSDGKLNAGALELATVSGLEDSDGLKVEAAQTLITSIAPSGGNLSLGADGSGTVTVQNDLKVDGAAEIDGALVVDGNLTVSGTTTTVNSTTVSVVDPMLILASSNDSSDTVDIGLYGLYDSSGSLDLYGGLFRDASDNGKWKLFKDNQAVPTTTVDTNGAGYAAATLVADIEGDVEGNVTGDLTGNADTATALETARTIALAGDVAGSVSFDGTGNVSITTTVQANSVALGTDTTGNYVAAGAVSGVGLSGSSSEEGGTFTVTSNATHANTASAIVSRDASGDFAAGTITAALTGDVTGTVSSIANHDTDSLGEGSSNLYYTDARAEAAAQGYFSGGEGIALSGTGVLSADLLAAGGLKIDSDKISIKLDSDADNPLALSASGLIFSDGGLINDHIAAGAAIQMSKTLLEVATGASEVQLDLSGDELSAELVDGGISNVHVAANAAIEDTKLDQISTADKVALSALAISSNVGSVTALADSDLFIVGPNKMAASVIPTYVKGKLSGGDGITFDDSNSGEIKVNASLSHITAISNSEGSLSVEDLSIAGGVVTGATSITSTAFVGALTGNASTASALQAAVDISLSGDLDGTVEFDGSSSVSISATIQPNSVALGTDTTGNYMSDVSAGTGVSVTHTQGEGSTATIAIGQAVATDSDVEFSTCSAGKFLLTGLSADATVGDATAANQLVFISAEDTVKKISHSAADKADAVKVCGVWDGSAMISAGIATIKVKDSESVSVGDVVYLSSEAGAVSATPLNPTAVANHQKVHLRIGFALAASTEAGGTVKVLLGIGEPTELLID